MQHKVPAAQMVQKTKVVSQVQPGSRQRMAPGPKSRPAVGQGTGGPRSERWEAAGRAAQQQLRQPHPKPQLQTRAQVTQYIDKAEDVPAVVQRQVPRVQAVQRIVEAPQVQ